MALLNPHEIVLTGDDGKEQKFVLSNFPAWDGLEIIERIPAAVLASTFPKIDDWRTTPELKRKIMSYVAVNLNGQYIPLVTQELIDNHCVNWKCLGTLLWREVEYNKGFFPGETLSSFFTDIAQRHLAKLFEIFTQSLEQSSQPIKPPSAS